MKVLNCGFFNLNDAYIDALKQLEICDDSAFEDLRTRTFLPMIDNESRPKEVFSLVKAALEVANPVDGDIVIVAGTPDVVHYIVEIVKATGARVLCPLGKTREGVFRLQGFREIVSDPDKEKMEASILHLVDGD